MSDDSTAAAEGTFDGNFCQLSTEFEDGPWIWFGILIVPFLLVFAGIYRLFRLPVKKFGVTVSIISSALTFAGLGAILIYSFEIYDKYELCGETRSGLPDFGPTESLDSAFTWYMVGICVSVLLYIIFFIFSLKADISKAAFGGVDAKVSKLNIFKRYLFKFLVLVMKFGLGAIYQPFYSVGYYDNGSGENEKCICVDDYIWSIAILFSIMLFGPIATKTTDAGTKIDNWLEIKPKKWPQAFDLVKKYGKISLQVAKWSGIVGMLTAAVTIIVIRFQRIVNDLIDLANSVSISDDGKGATVNYALLKVEYLVFILIVFHVILGFFFRKYLNGEVESTLGRNIGRCLFRCLGFILCNWCSKCHEKAATMSERAQHLNALTKGMSKVNVNLAKLEQMESVSGRGRSNSDPRSNSVHRSRAGSLASLANSPKASVTVRTDVQIDLEDLMKSHKQMKNETSTTVPSGVSGISSGKDSIQRIIEEDAKFNDGNGGADSGAESGMDGLVDVDSGADVTLDVKDVNAALAMDNFVDKTDETDKTDKTDKTEEKDKADESGNKEE